MDGVDGDASGGIITPINDNSVPSDHRGASITFREEHFDTYIKGILDGAPIECTVSTLGHRLVQLIVVAPRALPTKNPINGIEHEESPSLDDRIFIQPEACNAVNIQEKYNDYSTEAVLQAVEINGKHTLSLGGKDVISHSSWFKEYSHTHPNPHGAPNNTVYYYECYKFPGHYIRWHGVNQTFAVDCEPKTDIPCSSQFQWKKEPIEATNGGLQFSWLSAFIGNSSEVSPFYLTFQDGQPKIQQNTDSAMQFLISPAKPDPSAQTKLSC